MLDGLVQVGQGLFGPFGQFVDGFAHGALVLGGKADGGSAGGFAEKAQAAAQSGATLVVLRRPEECGETAEEILQRCRELL